VRAVSHRWRNVQTGSTENTKDLRVWEAVEARLTHDLANDVSANLVALTERADPVLVDLWDNPKDAMIASKPASELHSVEDKLREILAL
jgi:hypothetical protein